MANNDPYPSIMIYRDHRNHFLVRDLYYPSNRDPDYFFDLHEGRGYEIEDTTTIERLKLVTGKEYQTANRIYMDWKWVGKKQETISKKTNEKFPLNGRVKKRKLKRVISYKIEKPGIEEEPEEERVVQTKTPQVRNEHLAKPKNIINKQKTNNERESRAKDIQSIKTERQINNLIHFTHTRNLESIMMRGLLSRKEVDKLRKNEILKINDEQRIDKHPEAICLSISFPNYKMFYAFHQKDYENWVVISLKPDILWKYDCAFCHTNAASNECRFIDIFERKKVQAFRRLFEDFDNIKRQDLQIPDYYTTDPQAEVLVFDKIHTEDFLKVHFHSWTQMNKYKEAYPIFENLFDINKNYFRPRQDYQHWQNNQNNFVKNNAIDDHDEIPF